MRGALREMAEGAFIPAIIGAGLATVFGVMLLIKSAIEATR